MSNIYHTENEQQQKGKLIECFIIPVELIKYLTQDAIYRNKQKFSRLQAFDDLVTRLKVAKSNGETMAANYAQLCNAWKWSRPGLNSFLGKLKEFGLIEINVVVVNKVVSLKPQLLMNLSVSDLPIQLSKASSTPPQPLSTQFPLGQKRILDQGDKIDHRKGF